jgi:tRNA (guanine-N7-)-methyltransferase
VNPFDWERTFGRRAPRVLDVGCGEGDFLLASARSRPGHDHLGIDLLAPLVERARTRSAGLPNLRFLAGDAVKLVAALSDLDEIHVYHPQPYHHPEQVPLGMLGPAFFESCWRALKPDALLVLQTDHRGYGRHLLDAARRHFRTEVLPGPWPDAPDGRTRRERLARRKKLGILRVVARRRDVPLDEAPPAPYFDTPRRRVRVVRRRPGLAASGGDRVS